MCVCYIASVVSDSLRPYGLYPARLLCPWDSPGKNAGVGCHFLLQRIFWTKGWNPCLLCLLHWQAVSLPLKANERVLSSATSVTLTPVMMLTLHLICRALGLSYGEGNGNLLQYSCLENPRDRGASWAAVYGVAQSRTRLKRLRRRRRRKRRTKEQR